MEFYIEVLIKIKKGVYLKDLFNRRLTKIKRSSENISRRAYLSNNIGILFIRNYQDPWHFDKILELWCRQLNYISLSTINSEVVKELALREIQFDSRFRDLLKYIIRREFYEEVYYKTNVNYDEINLKVEKKLKELIDGKEYETPVFDPNIRVNNNCKNLEFEYLLSKKYFYLIDAKSNIYILIDNKFYLLVEDMYFVIYKNELILSNKEETLIEYLVPIYKINNGLHILNDDYDYETMITYFQNNSILHSQPIISPKVEETKFYSRSLPKRNYNISFDDFLNSLELTNYKRWVLIYKLLKEFQNDSCSEYECQKKHQENKEIYVGLVHSIRYIKEKNLILTNHVLEGSLKFSYIKKVNVLIIEFLPKINGIYILNEAVLKIILEMLYNVTDLENIKEIHISNNLIGPVVISKSILEKLPSLLQDSHYKLALKSEDILKSVYNDEISRRRVLDKERKKERKRLVVSVNKAKNKYNDFFNIAANGGVDLTKSIITQSCNDKKEYVIAYHKYRTNKAVRYRRTHIVEAPEIIDIENDNLKLKGFVISFPNGTTEIRNFTRNGYLNSALWNLLDNVYLNFSPFGEKHLFIVLPKTLDLTKFKFFDLPRKKPLIFISDNFRFIEQFRFLRLTYNKSCKNEKFCNVPIVYDPDIYDKVWGYRASSNTLYKDLKEKIDEEVERINREVIEVEEYRFAELKYMDYIPAVVSEELLKRFLQDLTDINKLEKFVSKTKDIKLLRVLNNQDLSRISSHSSKNVKNIIFFNTGKIRSIFRIIMLSDNEFRNALNFNDFNRVSFKHIQDLFDDYLIYFNNSKKKLLKIIYKIFDELVNSKEYYELLFRKKDFSLWSIGYIEKYNQSRSGITYFNFCKLANEILRDEDVVQSINRNDLISNYETIIMRLKNLSDNFSICLIIYIYDILKKSGIYFETGKSVSKEFIDELLETYPYNEEYYQQLIEKYINVPRRLLHLKLNAY